MVLNLTGPAPSLRGSLRVPGDKSISHRALLLAALAEGPSRISGLLEAGVTQVMLSALKSLGNDAEFIDRGDLVILGKPWQPPTEPLDCGNSGTTMRLLAGALTAQPIESTLTGSEQLRRRPMARVVEPLRAMGGRIEGANGHSQPPLHIRGGGLTGIEYRMPVDSAQVKSALLLAGLGAEGSTTVIESAPTRDHTERMLRSLGVPVVVRNGSIRVKALERPLPAFHMRIPGDASSAAFLAVAAASLSGSRIIIRDLGVNPRRTGFLDVMAEMGAPVELSNRRFQNGEPVADVRISAGQLQAVELAGDTVVRAIDELPVLALAMTQARGTSQVRGAEELRHKESNRIESLVLELTELGAQIEATKDGFRVHGPTQLQGAAVKAHGDHRLAMTLAVAGLLADGETLVAGAESISESFPGFVERLRQLGAKVG